MSLKLRDLQSSMSPAQRFREEVKTMEPEARKLMHLAWQMHRTPEAIRRWTEASKKIQSTFRGYVARREFKVVWDEFKREKEERERCEATQRCFEAEEYEECIQAFHLVKEEFRDSLFLIVGKSHVLLGQFSEGLVMFDALIVLGEEGRGRRRGRGGTKEEREKEARERERRKEELIEALFWKALVLSKREDWEGAYECMVQVLDKAESSEYFEFAAYLSGRLERWEEASFNIKQVVVRDRTNLKALKLSVLSLCAHQSFEEADDEAEVLVSKQRSADHFLLRGKTHALSRRWQEAEEDFLQSMRYKRVDNEEAEEGLRHVRWELEDLPMVDA